VEPRDDALLAKIPVGEIVAVRIVRGRSLPQHRLFRAILSHVAESTKFETDEALLLALKIRLGKCHPVKFPNGKVTLAAHSTSFEEMAQDEFQEFFNNSIRLICEEVIPGANGEELITRVQKMLEPTRDTGQRAEAR
jgi:hypothetical protein